MKVWNFIGKMKEKVYRPIWKKVCEIGSVFISTLSAIIIGILASFVIYSKSAHYAINNIGEIEQLLCDFEQFFSLLLIVPLVIDLSIRLNKSENLYQKIKHESNVEQSLWVYNNSISQQVGDRIMKLIGLFVIFTVFILYQVIFL